MMFLRKKLFTSAYFQVRFILHDQNQVEVLYAKG